MPHVVLLGDSIFDNAAYVRGGPDVVTQLREVLPEGWGATLAAVDGATAPAMGMQLRRIRADATHLVLSIGGNDALGHVGILEQRASSAAEVLAMLADVRDRGLPVIELRLVCGEAEDYANPIEPSARGGEKIARAIARAAAGAGSRVVASPG